MRDSDHHRPRQNVATVSVSTAVAAPAVTARSAPDAARDGIAHVRRIVSRMSLPLSWSWPAQDVGPGGSVGAVGPVAAAVRDGSDPNVGAGVPSRVVPGAESRSSLVRIRAAQILAAPRSGAQLSKSPRPRIRLVSPRLRLAASLRSIEPLEGLVARRGLGAGAIAAERISPSLRSASSRFWSCDLCALALTVSTPLTRR